VRSTGTTKSRVAIPDSGQTLDLSNDNDFGIDLIFRNLRSVLLPGISSCPQQRYGSGDSGELSAGDIQDLTVVEDSLSTTSSPVAGQDGPASTAKVAPSGRRKAW
jgi:hypothetical protein